LVVTRNHIRASIRVLIFASESFHPRLTKSSDATWLYHRKNDDQEELDFRTVCRVYTFILPLGMKRASSLLQAKLAPLVNEACASSWLRLASPARYVAPLSRKPMISDGVAAKASRSARNEMMLRGPCCPSLLLEGISVQMM